MTKRDKVVLCAHFAVHTSQFTDRKTQKYYDILNSLSITSTSIQRNLVSAKELRCICDTTIKNQHISAIYFPFFLRKKIETVYKRD